MAAFIAAPVIQKEAWAQCENSNCQKWRRLPAGTVIDENEPWYCYMNPDLERNTCSASEVEYDEEKELVIDGTIDPEEAARNAKIIQDIEASIAATAAAALAAGRGRGRGRARGRGRRGRPPTTGRGSAMYAPPVALPYDHYATLAPGMKRNKTVSIMTDDYDAQFDSDITPGAGRPPSRMSRKQVSKTLQRLLDNDGQWESQRGSGASMLPAPVPAEAWEALAMTAPDAAVIASQAADLASSMKYFESSAAGNEKKQEIVNDIGAMARLSMMMAAASGLVETKDVLNDVEREKFGVVGEGVVAAKLPNPEEPLPGGS